MQPAILEVHTQEIHVTNNSARVGDTATGVVVQESEGELHLNVSPCASETKIVVFKRPYVKEGAGGITCPSGARKEMQSVTQGKQ